MSEDDDTKVVPLKPEVLDQDSPYATESIEVLHPDVVDDQHLYGSRTDSGATLAFALAVLSFIFLPVIGALAALGIAPGAKRRIRRSEGQLAGAKLARAAQILAVLNIALVAAFLYLVVSVLDWAISSI